MEKVFHHCISDKDNTSNGISNSKITTGFDWTESKYLERIWSSKRWKSSRLYSII